ncbi:MAG: hypothetical protein OXH70_02350 [Acidobacteria bacterium]|nr:hypothetical protein [Acidobacteriota bacterium]
MAAAPDKAEMAVPVDAVPKVVATATAAVGPNTASPTPAVAPAKAAATADLPGCGELLLYPLNDALEPIRGDTKRADRLVEVLGCVRQSVHVVLDGTDHLYDNPPPLLEQSGAGLIHLLAEILVSTD